MKEEPIEVRTQKLGRQRQTVWWALRRKRVWVFKITIVSPKNARIRVTPVWLLAVFPALYIQCLSKR